MKAKHSGRVLSVRVHFLVSRLAEFNREALAAPAFLLYALLSCDGLILCLTSNRGGFLFGRLLAKYAPNRRTCQDCHEQDRI